MLAGVLDTFSYAFSEKNEVKLFNLRASMIHRLHILCSDLVRNDFEKASIEEICKGLAHSNLEDKFEKIEHLFSSSHIALMNHLFSQQDRKPRNVKEINDLTQELHEYIQDEDLEKEQKLILDDIVLDIKCSISEHKTSGNKAISKLFYILAGKFVIHKEELSKIKSSKIKDHIKTIFKEVFEANRVINASVSIQNNAMKFVEFFN